MKQLCGVLENTQLFIDASEWKSYKTKIGKKSKTTYAKWCELKGFKYHCVYSTGKMLPDKWVKELHQQQKKL